MHLEKLPKEPIGWALDGFALYGLYEPDGSPARSLDAFNGHQHDARGYHYHSSKAYPYVNGGLRGEVTVIDDAISPQPRTDPVRPAGRPLSGARIVGFQNPSANRYSVEYTVGGEHCFIHYTVDGNNRFTFVEGNGESRTETYKRRTRRERKRP